MRQPTLGEFLDYLEEVALQAELEKGALDAPVYYTTDGASLPENGADFISLKTIYYNLVDELNEEEEERGGPPV